MNKKNIGQQIIETFIAAGYMVPPTSKLPFLNIITDVLLIHVPIIKVIRNAYK